MRFPLWIKLPIAFGLLLAVMIYSAWHAKAGIDSIKQILVHELRDDAIPGLYSMGRVGYLITMLRGDFWRHHAVANVPEKAIHIETEFDHGLKTMQQAMKDYESAITRDEDRALFSQLRESTSLYFHNMNDAMKMDRNGDKAGFTQSAEVIAKQFNTEINPLLQTMISKNGEWAKIACNDALELSDTVNSTTKLGTIIAVGFGLTIAVLLCLHILIPLARCRRLVDSMALGRINDGDGRDRLLQRGDELGDIARSTHAMSEYLREMADTARAIANCNLTRTVTPRGTDDALGTAFSGMHHNLTKDISMLSTNAKTLASSAQELTAVSTQMASSAEEASVQAAEVSSAGEQVHQSISSVASAIEEIDASIKGIAINTHEMSEQINKAAKVANSLAQASAEVGNIVKTVRATADRTNLLALNANIEAASAGEAGRGFAVVANEVKDLAKQSLMAAEQANRILSQMSREADEVNSLTKTASQTVLTVASAVEEQSTTMNDISRNMAEAANAVALIASSVTEIATAGRETAAGVVQIKGAADDMARQTAQIAVMVDRFQLPA